MKIQLIAASAAAVCALAACQSPATGHTVHGTQTGNHQAQAVNMPDEQFVCRNGMTATVKYVGNSRIAVSIDTDNRTVAVMPQVRAASGEMYAANNGLYGKPTQWHQKDGEAAFLFHDPHGNKTETVCRRK